MKKKQKLYLNIDLSRIEGVDLLKTEWTYFVPKKKGHKTIIEQVFLTENFEFYVEYSYIPE